MIGKTLIYMVPLLIAAMGGLLTEKAGVLKRILVENGQPVEYNQPMFVIE